MNFLLSANCLLLIEDDVDLGESISYSLLVLAGLVGPAMNMRGEELRHLSEALGGYRFLLGSTQRSRGRTPGKEKDRVVCRHRPAFRGMDSDLHHRYRTGCSDLHVGGDRNRPNPRVPSRP